MLAATAVAGGAAWHFHNSQMELPFNRYAVKIGASVFSCSTPNGHFQQNKDDSTQWDWVDTQANAAQQ